MKEMVGGCCVCSDDRGWPENPLVYCDGQACTVAVHQACYGIVTVPTGPWYCRKCESQERAVKVKCELCPSKYGALKRTDNGGWAHVVCALYIPEVRFGNVTTMEPIQLQLIPQERFNKVCYICEEGGKASNAGVGACMQCNKSGCKQQFHVTCAQGLGLLCEEAGNYLDNVKYCGYCQHHYSKLKKGINIKTIPPYKPLPSETHQSDSSSEKETDNSSAPSTVANINTATATSCGNSSVNSSTTGTTSSTTNTSGGTSVAGAAASTATTGKRKYYSNSKAKIEKSTANNNQQSIASLTSTATSKTHQKKSNSNVSSSVSDTKSSSTVSSSSSTASSSSSSSSSTSSSTKNNSQTNNSQKVLSANINSVCASVVSGIKEEQFKVEVKVEVKKEVEDAVAAASAAAAAAASACAAPSSKGKKRKANSRTPTPNTVGAVSDSIATSGAGDNVTEVKKETAVIESKKIKPNDAPTPLISTTANVSQTITPPITATTTTPPIVQTIPTAHTPPTTTALIPSVVATTALSLTSNASSHPFIQATPAPVPTTAPSTVNSLVVSVPLMPLVPSSTITNQTVHSLSPRPIISTSVLNNQQGVNDSFIGAFTGFSTVIDSRQHQQVLSGSLDINGIAVSQNSLLLEQDSMLTSELSGSGGLKIMFEKQCAPSSAVQAEIDRITPTHEIPMKRSRSQSMEKNDKIMRSSKKRSSNGLTNAQVNNILPSSASPVAGGSAATPPPSVVSTITKRASRSQHPTPPPSITSQFGQIQSGMLGMSISATNQIKDSPPSSPSSESLGGPPVARKKGRKSAPASVSSSSSSNTAKDTKDIKDSKENIKLFQNGIHAPHMLGNQLNPNSNMAQKMSDHLSSELEAHSIFNSTDGNTTLVGPQLHNRVLSSARSSSTGGSSTASAGSGLSSMLGGGSGAIPQTLDQLLERQWEQGSQFLMEQAQHFDIASLLSCLHQLRAENTRLEEHVSSLLQRRDHLLAVNARLAIPLTGPPATPQSSHPHTVNNIHPSLAANHADMTSRPSRHGSSSAYSHMVPIENGLPPSEVAYVQPHSHRATTSHSGQAQPSPTIRHNSSSYGSGSSGAGVSGLMRSSESSSSGGTSRPSSSRSHQPQPQQHYIYQPTQQQQMQMRRDSDMHHHPSTKPS